MINFYGIIPARYQSSRFPGKPLINIAGKPMIQRVYEQANKAGLKQVIVATDHQEIADCVQAFGGNCIMTSPNHQSGTDRCAEVAQIMDLKSEEVVINIQGDEPFIMPEQIQLLCDCFGEVSTQVATLAKPIESQQELEKNSVVKVVRNNFDDALFFSRSIIPYPHQKTVTDCLQERIFLKHLGIYGYRVHILSEISKLPQSALEKIESLEQLRWLSQGYTIKVTITPYETIAIDTPDDIAFALKYLKENPEFNN